MLEHRILLSAVSVQDHLAGFEPAIYVSSPEGEEQAARDAAIDQRNLQSPFSGVVSIDVGGGTGTGALISDWHIVTAAHNVDFSPGDGEVDAGLLENLKVYFAHTGSTPYEVVRIAIHNDWDGYLEGTPLSLNDDIAVLTLMEEAPAGAARYTVDTKSIDAVKDYPIVHAGFGRYGSGNGDVTNLDGPSAGTLTSSRDRYVGRNLASSFLLDDEGTGTPETWISDFDGPNGTFNTLNDGDALPTLTTDQGVSVAEAGIGKGDSGGPVFRWDETSSADTRISSGELIWWGNATANNPQGIGTIPHIPDAGTDGLPDNRRYGSWSGGMVGAAYLGFLAEETARIEPIGYELGENTRTRISISTAVPTDTLKLEQLTLDRWDVTTGQKTTELLANVAGASLTHKSYAPGHYVLDLGVMPSGFDYRLSVGTRQEAKFSGLHAGINWSTAAPLISMETVSPDPRTTQVESIAITSSRPVDNLATSDFQLTRNGVIVTGGALEPNPANSKDSFTYTIPEAADSHGTYQLTFLPNRTKATVTATNSLAKDLKPTKATTEAWLVRRPGFEIPSSEGAPEISIETVSPDPRTTQVASIAITTSQPVANLAASDFQLTWNGVTVTGGQLTANPANSKDNFIYSLPATGDSPGTYQLTFLPNRTEATTTNLDGDQLKPTKATTEAWVVTAPGSNAVQFTPDVPFPLPVSSGEQVLSGHDIFGQDVDIDGGWAVVGAPKFDGVATDGSLVDSGAAFVYQFTGGAWVYRQKLEASDRASEDGFGHSVAINGNVIVVGSPYRDQGDDTDVGQAYVFERSANTFSQQKILTTDLTANLAYDRFGWDVDIDSDTIGIVGEGGSSGFQVSERINGTWTDADYIDGGSSFVSVSGQRVATSGYIHYRDETQSDGWGRHNGVSARVGALDGDILVTGDPGYDGSSLTYVYRTGRVQVRRVVDNSTKFVQYITPTEPDHYGQFGAAVAIHDGIIAVGAPFYEQQAGDAGMVAMFHEKDGQFTLLREVYDRNGEAFDHFGTSVAISDGSVLVGIPGSDTTEIAAGGVAFLQGGSGTKDIELVSVTNSKTNHVSATLTTDNVSDSFVVNVYRSADRTLDVVATDPVAATVTVTPAGGAETIVLDVGDYDPARPFLIVMVDGGEAIDEYIETNNVTSIRQTPAAYSPDADLPLPFNDAGTLLSGHDIFGQDVAIDGDWAVVGAPKFDGVATDGSLVDSGAAFVYQFTGGVWEYRQKLEASDRASEDHFGHSVAINGNVIVVGSPYRDQGDDADVGQAYVFERSANTFSQQKILTTDLTANLAYDRFGWDVDIDSDTIGIVGEGGSSGFQVSERINGTWTDADYIDGGSSFVSVSGQRVATSGYIHYRDETQSDGWGRHNGVSARVGALDGDILVTGDPGYDGSSLTSVYSTGRVQVRRVVDNSTKFVQFINPTEPDHYGQFGAAVAIHDGIIAVGASNKDREESIGGSVDIYVDRGDDWGHLQTIDDDWRGFGHSVALSASSVLVGAPSVEGVDIADRVRVFSGGDVQAAVLTADIIDVSPDPRSQPVGEVVIEYSEDVATLEIDEFQLTRNGQAIDITGLTLNGSGARYSIDLGSVTTVPGDYELRLVAEDSDAITADGAGLEADVVESWVVESSEPPGFVVSSEHLDVPEGGSTTFTVRLATQPESTVRTEIFADTSLPGVRSIEPNFHEFTPSNWNQPITITVTALEDDVVSGNLEGSFQLRNPSGDADYQGMTTSIMTTIVDNETDDKPANVDGDSDFDANDSFLIQLVALAGSDAQIDSNKGASSLTATQIRERVAAMHSVADVDGDGDFDANDGFLMHLVKLAGSNANIDASKGPSPLSAQQIRTRINGMGGGNSPQGNSTAAQEAVLQAVLAESEVESLWGIDEYLETQRLQRQQRATSGYSNEAALFDVWGEHRDWLDAALLS